MRYPLANRRQGRCFSMPFGCERTAEGGYRFRLWAPALSRVDLELNGQGGASVVAMTPLDDGWFEHHSPTTLAGDFYAYRLQTGLRVPDPASRYQPADVHGPSMVVDPLAFQWRDGNWRGRPWHEAVIYELHPGAFSASGDFAAIEARLDGLRDLGVTAIELMPIADFPGRWNWGYDGALLFAPDSRYGRPDDLKRLVQAAHQRGLMVFLDVVYNHFGPEGNYLHCYAPGFFHPERHTPWGAALHFDGAGSAVVREFFIANALFWLTEYHFDGLRLDAVDRILDQSRPDILDELAERVRSGPGAARQVHLILENDHNDARRYRRHPDDGRVRHFTAQWNDDVHHALHVVLTGEDDGVYQDYATAPYQHLGRALAEGFCYQGEPSAFREGCCRGTPSAELPPLAFVNFLQNHDQIGNRARGDRLERLIAEPALEAALALVLLAPAPPLLFMGQEFAASSPFLFFCDLEPGLLQAVRDGRRREFARQAGFRDAGEAALNAIPDPGDPRTFQASRLDWTQTQSPLGQRRLALHRELLRLRAREIIPLLPGFAGAGQWRMLGATGLFWRWRGKTGAVLSLQANLAPVPLDPDAAPEDALDVGAQLIYEHPRRDDARWPAWWVCCRLSAPA